MLQPSILGALALQKKVAFPLQEKRPSLRGPLCPPRSEMSPIRGRKHLRGTLENRAGASAPLPRTPGETARAAYGSGGSGRWSRKLRWAREDGSSPERRSSQSGDAGSRVTLSERSLPFNWLAENSQASSFQTRGLYYSESKAESGLRRESRGSHKLTSAATSPATRGWSLTTAPTHSARYCLPRGRTQSTCAEKCKAQPGRFPEAHRVKAMPDFKTRILREPSSDKRGRRVPNRALKYPTGLSLWDEFEVFRAKWLIISLSTSGPRWYFDHETLP